MDSTIRSPPFPWFQPVPKQLNPLHDQQTLGLSMPKPYPRPMCQAARFWRDKCAVCLGRTKCAGCTEQGGTKLCTENHDPLTLSRFTPFSRV